MKHGVFDNLSVFIYQSLMIHLLWLFKQYLLYQFALTLSKHILIQYLPIRLSILITRKLGKSKRCRYSFIDCLQDLHECIGGGSHLCSKHVSNFGQPYFTAIWNIRIVFTRNIECKTVIINQQFREVVYNMQYVFVYCLTR